MSCCHRNNSQTKKGHSVYAHILFMSNNMKYNDCRFRFFFFNFVCSLRHLACSRGRMSVCVSVSVCLCLYATATNCIKQFERMRTNRPQTLRFLSKRKKKAKKKRNQIAVCMEHFHVLHSHMHTQRGHTCFRQRTVRITFFANMYFGGACNFNEVFGQCQTNYHETWTSHNIHHSLTRSLAHSGAWSAAGPLTPGQFQLYLFICLFNIKINSYSIHRMVIFDLSVRIVGNDFYLALNAVTTHESWANHSDVLK